MSAYDVRSSLGPPRPTLAAAAIGIALALLALVRMHVGIRRLRRSLAWASATHTGDGWVTLTADGSRVHVPAAAHFLPGPVLVENASSIGRDYRESTVAASGGATTRESVEARIATLVHLSHAVALTVLLGFGGGVLLAGITGVPPLW
jgi:hypothetical protein